MSLGQAGVILGFALVPPQSAGLDSAPGDGGKSVRPVELSIFRVTA